MNAIRNRKCHPQYRNGFSVWEALLIIFILIVLAAFLFPIFARTRTPGRKSNCQNNLKSLAIALQLYLNDYDGHLPSSALVNHSKKWNRADFLKFTARTGIRPSPGRPQTYAQVLYDHMKSKDIIFCTSDDSDHNGADAKCSYWWKLAIDKAWYGEGCKKPCQKETDFVYNSDQVVFYERKGFHDGGSGLKNGTQINVAYLDSHVKTITLRNCKPGYTNTPAPSAGEPAYFNHDFGSDEGALPQDTPAKYVDPARYGDRL
jgi:hypothetical protein